jgi:hypothetical protein
MFTTKLMYALHIITRLFWIDIVPCKKSDLCRPPSPRRRYIIISKSRVKMCIAYINFVVNMNDQLIAVMKAGAERYKLRTSCNRYFSISFHACYCALCFLRNFRNCFKLQIVCLIKMSMCSYEDPSRFQDAENCIIWNFSLQFVGHDLCLLWHNIGMYLSAPAFITSNNCKFRITEFSF